uniref:Uncharacterized protein n=1 Tax=Arundo donax TaxID=35708 RepID=A0A0A8ZX03_ARUDO
MVKRHPAPFACRSLEFFRIYQKPSNAALCNVQVLLMICVTILNGIISYLPLQFSAIPYLPLSVTQGAPTCH